MLNKKIEIKKQNNMKTMGLPCAHQMRNWKNLVIPLGKYTCDGELMLKNSIIRMQRIE
jgi:hypothetical protein